MLTVVIDIEKVAHVVFEFLLDQNGVQVFVMVASNAQISLRVVEVVRR